MHPAETFDQQKLHPDRTKKLACRGVMLQRQITKRDEVIFISLFYELG
jgi:hypothetical protein